jgi:hypothetical protein
MIGNQVHVTWSPAVGATSYVVQYKLASAGPSAYATATVTASTEVTVTDATGLLNGSAYVFQVKGVGVADESPYVTSNQVVPTDQTAPVASVQTVPASANAAGWFSVIPTYTITAVDPSGIARYEATIDNSTTVQVIANGGPVGGVMTDAAVEGTQTIKYRAVDGAGNVGVWASKVFNVDKTKPRVDRALGTVTTGLAGWYTTVPTITLTPSDTSTANAVSGVASTSYFWNTGTPTVASTDAPVAFQAPQGSNLLTYSALDVAGNSSIVTTFPIKVDSIAPSAPASPTLTLKPAGGIDVAWAASTDAASGVATYAVEWSTASTFPPTPESAVVTAGVTSYSIAGSVLIDATKYYVRVTAMDNAGNASVGGYSSATADKTPPSVTILGANASWTATTSIPATITATDGGSGLFNIKYRWYPASAAATGTFSAPSAATTTPVSAPQGDYILEAVGTDVAGNNATATGAFKSDWTKPVSTFRIDQAAPNGLNSWYTSATVSITATDLPAPVSGAKISSGVSTLTVNGVAAAYSSPYTWSSTQGTNTIVYFATDAAGNVESASATQTFKFDSVVPTIAATFLGGYVDNAATTTAPSAKLTAGDLTSGVDMIKYAFVPYGSSPVTATVWTTVSASEATATAPQGHLALYFKSYDKAGLVSALGGPFNTLYDATTPVTSYTTVPTSPDGGLGTWKTPPAITFSVSGPATDSVTTYFRWDTTGTVGPGTSTAAPSTTGTHTLEYYSKTATLIQEATKTATFFVNTSQPVVTWLLNNDVPSSAWYNSVTTATVTATTTASGPAIANIFWKYDAASTWTTYTVGATGFPVIEGVHTLTAYSVDASGVTGAQKAVSYKLDLTKPVVSPATVVVTSATATVTIGVTEAGSGLASGVMTRPGESATVTTSTAGLNGKFLMPWAVGDNLVLVTATDVAGLPSVATYVHVTYVTAYTISASSGANGVVSPAGATSVAVNGTQAYTITPNAGYHIEQVLVDGSPVAGAPSTYTFSNVTDAHTISATFAINTFAMTITAPTNGTITGPTSAAFGSDAVFTITPAAGYHVVGVTDNGVAQGALASYTVFNVQGTHTIAATFAANVTPPPSTFTITGTAGSNGTLSVLGAHTIAAGSNLTVAIMPDSGYHVAGVTVDGDSVGAVSGYTFTNVSANHTIAATFAADATPPPSTFTITGTAGSHGTLSVLGAQTVAAGSNLTVAIMPALGYHVAGVTVDGVSVGAVSSYTFTNVSANHTIAATFAPAKVSTRLSINARHASVRHGTTDYFFGVLLPSMPNGTHVRFYVRKPGSRVYRLVSTRHTFGSHHWNYTYRLASRGTYYFKVRFIGSSAFWPHWSRTIKVIAR